MTPELFRMQYVPVILGSGQKAAHLARRLFSLFGVASHIVDVHLPLRHRLCPWLICHPLPKEARGELVALALTDLAREIERCDRTPLLFVCPSPLTPDLSGCQKDLEQALIFVHPTQKPLGLLIYPEKPTKGASRI